MGINVVCALLHVLTAGCAAAHAAREELETQLSYMQQASQSLPWLSFCGVCSSVAQGVAYPLGFARTRMQVGARNCYLLARICCLQNLLLSCWVHEQGL